MSPFASLLHEMRTQRGLRQFELAEMIGYEKSYLSSLEIGTKGPPTPEFVERLIATLKLEAEEQSRLYAAVQASQRKIVLEPNSPAETYWLLSDLRERRAIDTAELQAFKNKYVSLVEVAAILGCSPRRAWLDFQGSAVCGPSIDGARQYFFLRPDIF